MSPILSLSLCFYHFSPYRVCAVRLQCTHLSVIFSHWLTAKNVARSLGLLLPLLLAQLVQLQQLQEGDCEQEKEQEGGRESA